MLRREGNQAESKTFAYIRGVLLAAVVFSVATAALCRPADDDLTAAMLAKFGLHLPAYLNDLEQQQKAQAALQSHVRLVIQWDAVPGAAPDATIDQNTRDALSGGSFTVKSEVFYPYAPRPYRDLRLAPGKIFIIGHSKSGEIRALTGTHGDPLIARDDRGAPPPLPGQPARAGAFVVDYHVWTEFYPEIPADPAISQISFLMVHCAQACELRELGTIDVTIKGEQ